MKAGGGSLRAWPSCRGRIARRVGRASGKWLIALAIAAIPATASAATLTQMSEVEIVQAIEGLKFALPAGWTQLAPVTCSTLPGLAYNAFCSVRFNDPGAPTAQPLLIFYVFGKPGGFDYITNNMNAYVMKQPGLKAKVTATLSVVNSKTHLNDSYPVNCYQNVNPKSEADCALNGIGPVVIAAAVQPSATTDMTVDINEAEAALQLALLIFVPLIY